MKISSEELEKHVRESHRLALAGDMDFAHYRDVQDQEFRLA